MKEYNKKSELRIIIFVVLITAGLLIISTYAWLLTQNVLNITNFSGKVDVTNGLEISLDGLNWSKTIELNEETTILNSAYVGNRNIWPKEMLPVSTQGIVSTETEKDLKMIRGTLNSNKTLSDLVLTNEELALNPDQLTHNVNEKEYPGYFAFDIFLKNISKQYTYPETLQLNYNSSLEIIENGNKEAGLQNTVRIALAKYGTGEVQSGTGFETVRSGVANIEDSQQEVLQKTGAIGSNNEQYITDVAIWEPNANDHVEYIVNNNNMITWTSIDGPKYGVYSQETGYYLFSTTTQMPTYAVKEIALQGEKKINDIYLWNGTEEKLGKQITLQTTKKTANDYTIKEGVQNLISTKDENKLFTIAPNSITRLRVYIWLEGQDVDCINYATHGGGVIINLGLAKYGTTGATE